MEHHKQYGGSTSKPTLWDKIWRNDDGEVVIFQWPNIWLIFWAAANFVSVVSPTRGLSKIMWWIGFVFIMIWAGLELFRGANYFRRGLGLVVIFASIMSAIHGGL